MTSGGHIGGDFTVTANPAFLDTRSAYFDTLWAVQEEAKVTLWDMSLIVTCVERQESRDVVTNGGCSVKYDISGSKEGCLKSNCMIVMAIITITVSIIIIIITNIIIIAIIIITFFCLSLCLCLSLPSLSLSLPPLYSLSTLSLYSLSTPSPLPHCSLSVCRQRFRPERVRPSV